MIGNCFSRRSGAKKKYWSKEEAEGVAKGTSKIYNEPMRAYACPHCGAWHVGSCRK
jgi:hypothetical protein